MRNTPKDKQTTDLINAIIEGIRKKKGLDILLMDLTKTGNTECSYFVLCHGNSNTQTESIARSVEDTVEELTGDRAWHTDGYRNAQWILVDYMDVMVHVFQKEVRNLYDIEDLWADAEMTTYSSEI
ncbi:MAG: ribosome silencing factor [Bacteroidota bacterium]|nr:ribosome silencing factor [Bacteroidota bacterium]